jgi:tetratricopeptide (TPR) repeat protein
MAKLPPPDPRYLKALPTLQEGVQLYRQGRTDEAEGHFLQALKKAPDHPDALYFLGLIRMDRGKPEETLKLMGKAARSNPRFAEAHFVSGSALNTLGRPQEALAAYRRAIAISPEHVNALNHLGNTLRLLGQLKEAIAAYDKAIAAAPNFAAPYSNRGAALAELGDLETALASFDRALALQPDFIDALNNRGGVLQKLNRAEEAIANYDRALAIKGDFAEALNNRGSALQDLNQHREAVHWHRRALEIRPDNAEAHFNAASAHLCLGEFAQGWPEFEWRWRKNDLAPLRRPIRQPLWLGDGAIAGKTILLHAEQGFGDTIHFARYVPLVARLGAKVVLEVPRPLRALCETLDGVSTLVTRGDKLPSFDLHTPLLSLPLAFRTDINTIPADVPYLSAQPDRIAKWSDRMSGRPGRKVGLAWSGRIYPRNRSVPFVQLGPLLSLPNTVFVSLQQEIAHQDAALFAGQTHVLHFGDEIQDFADTAAIIASLDLVLSIDTSVAHLAGAMGKPLWLLLLYGSDFRWLVDREDSPWYPTARLFRQPSIGDWTDVVSRVGADLAR